MKVLFTSPILEHPAAGGPQLRIENSIKALSGVCELHVLSRAAGPDAERSRTREHLAPYCLTYATLPRLERPTGGGLRRVRRVARRMLGLELAEDAAFLLQRVDQLGIDVVWFGYGNISYPLMRRVRELRPSLRLVCDTDSVWSRFVLRELPYAQGLRRARIARAGRAKEREERAWVELCDVTTAVSEVDAEYYRGLASRPRRVHVFSNVIDLQSYEERPDRLPGFRSPSIYLAGTFGHAHSPMDTAARWVLEKVFPTLLERHPDLHFYLVGRGSDQGFGHLNGPNLTATGRLDSVLPYLCHASVALVPLMFESGTRFKILEAGACGVPLVSTTLGAEGIPVVDGEHLLIADEPVAFAEAVSRVLRDADLAAKLARNCRALVGERFSIGSLAREAQAILGYIAREQRA